MTVEAAEKVGSCIVRINERDYRNSGLRFMLYQTYREFDDEGNICHYGVVCRDATDTPLDTEAKYIDMDELPYQKTKYRPLPSKMSMKEIYALGGKAVCYEGNCVRIRRICKDYDSDNFWRYTLVLQETTAPYAVFDAECYEISPWDGEQPETVAKEKPPIVQRHKEKQAAEAAKKESIKEIQDRTLKILKSLAV